MILKWSMRSLCPIDVHALSDSILTYSLTVFFAIRLLLSAVVDIDNL